MALSACKHRVSGSFSLPSRGTFHLSLTVLISIGHQVVFSLTGWSPLFHTRFLVSRTTLDILRLVFTFVYRTFTFFGLPSLVVLLALTLTFLVFRTPVILLYLVWALPISLATTLRIVFTFSSYGYWDVSVPHVPFLYTTLLMYGYIVSFYYVSSLIRISMGRWIFAPYHSFSQLITSFFGSWCQGILPMLFVA